MPTPDPSLPSPEGRDAKVSWRRNLAALWLAEFTAIFGFSFAFPFLPVFLAQDLGVHSAHDLAFWSGLVGSASGWSLALASPVWGVLGDRYGRKPMVIRSMIGGGITVGLIAFSRGPVDLVVLRFLQGLASGTVAAATALVAAETPRERVGWALGVLTSSIALGGAIGPATGGLAAGVLGLRNIFLAGGLLLLAAAIPVLLLVRESPVRSTGQKQVAALEIIRSARPGTLRALSVLIGAQGILTVGNSAFQQLVVLKLVALLAGGTAAVTGIAFGLSGLASSIASVTYSWATSRAGYARTSALLAVGLAIAYGLVAVATGAPLVVAGVTLAGLLGGAILPAISSMLGLEAPPEVQARIFGLSSSSIAIGFAIGPLLGGGVAATASVEAALLVSGGISLLLAALLFLAAREPAA